MSEHSLHPTNRHQRRLWFTPWGVALLVPLMLAVTVLATSPNFQEIEGVRASPFGGDFLQEWVAGRMLISAEASKLYRSRAFTELQHDHSLTGFSWKPTSYYPPVYPPGYYLAVSPLAHLPYRVAAVIWLLASLGCLWATLWLLYRFHLPSRRWFPWLAVGAAIFSPLLFSLNIGHKSIFLLLIFTATYLLLDRGKLTWAGLCFGLLAFKPHLLVVVVAVMFCKGQWRFLGGLLITIAGWLLLCLAAGPELCVDYARFVFSTSDYVTAGGYKLEMAHSLWSFSQLLFGGLGSTGVKLIAGSLAILTLAWILRLTRGPLQAGEAKLGWQFSAMVIGTILVSPHFYQYDLTMVLLPIILAVGLSKSLPTRPAHLLMASSMFLLCGAFQSIASATHVQVSCLIFGAWLFLLDREIRLAGGHAPARPLLLANQQPADDGHLNVACNDAAQ